MEGQTLSHYRVLERLGGGGMGVVYKALDTRLDRPVALKFLPPELTRDDEARRRFIQEAKAASALDHPNICTIYEIDSTPDGRLFIAMSFLDGETLKKRVERGPLPVEEAVEIAVQMAQGLAKAHGAGIIHRDIKPANLMMTKDGVVKIVDFGIAKLLGVTGPTQTGTTLGTVAYMSPEQIQGDDATPRSDLWSLGVVLYEMLTGALPFRGERQVVVMNAIVDQPPKPMRAVRPEVPEDVERIVVRALEKKPEARHGSASELLRQLTACRMRLTSVVAARPAESAWGVLRQPKVAAVVVALLALAGIGVGWAWTRNVNVRWAREEAIPEIQRLVEQDQYAAAYAVAEEVERYIPADAALTTLWPTISVTGPIRTEPSGADVYMSAYGSDEWIPLGRTPLEAPRMPRGTFRLRIEKQGYETVHLAGVTRPVLPGPRPLIVGFPDGVEISLDPVGTVPPRMVAVPGGEFQMGLTGFATGELATVDRFFVDTYEVTNREFKEFVDAGGYEKPEYWAGLTFAKDGRELSWQEAMAEFRDASGRPGPSTWELGNYPDGQDEYPVMGVSWYEAMAYAKYRGRALPTVFHWARAALPTREIAFPLGPSIVPVSNFGSSGPAPVGSHRGLGPYGTYDTAGNVREWCLNASGDLRWILGGGWSDPEYMFSIPNYQPPFDRSPLNGFRTVMYADAVAGTLTAPVDTASRDYRSETPVSDEVYQILQREFSYEKTPLNAAVEARDESSEAWIRDTVTFDAGYADERTTAYVFLPRNGRPPYQTVVHFPGIGPFLGAGPSANLQPGPLDFVVRSGRALIAPVWKGSYERWDEFLSLAGERYDRTFRERMLQWHQDLARTIDYIETRDDLDAERVAYSGASFGASTAFPIIAVESRLRTAVLSSVGLPYRKVPPIADAINFVPRVTIPVLMVSGTYDYVFPVETTQKPMFALLGTPAEHKRHVLLDSGHAPLPRNQLLREYLDWLDKYLGPVN